MDVISDLLHRRIGKTQNFIKTCFGEALRGSNRSLSFPTFAKVRRIRQIFHLSERENPSEILLYLSWARLRNDEDLLAKH
jgi:hypothetical protein